MAAGISYGASQASVLLEKKPALASALLLVSYPLHKPFNEVFIEEVARYRNITTEKRVPHFLNLRTPTLFVHSSRDLRASLDEIQDARALIPARTSLRIVDYMGSLELANGPFKWVDGIVADLAEVADLPTRATLSRARREKGLSLFNSSHLLEALSTFEEVLTLDPSDTDIWNKKGLIIAKDT